MTHPDTTRPPMSETVKPLTVEKIAEYREVVKCGPHLGVGGAALASILDSHEELRARAEKAERDLAQSREMNESPNYCSACGDSFASFVQHGCVGFDKHELEKPCPLEALPTTGSAP